MNDKLPSEMKKEHTWRTREDPFWEVWEEVKSKLDVNPYILNEAEELI